MANRKFEFVFYWLMFLSLFATGQIHYPHPALEIVGKDTFKCQVISNEQGHIVHSIFVHDTLEASEIQSLSEEVFNLRMATSEGDSTKMLLLEAVNRCEDMATAKDSIILYQSVQITHQKKAIKRRMIWGIIKDVGLAVTVLILLVK